MNINPIGVTYFRGGRPGMDDMSAEQKHRTARSECEGDFCAPYQGSYSAGDAAISSDEKHQFSYLA